MTTATVTALGYIGCSVQDIEQWDLMLGQVFGVKSRPVDVDTMRQYRIDEYHHRLTLYQRDREGLDYIGWEVRTQKDLDELEQRLLQSGTKVERGDLALCKERAVLDLIVFDGPDLVRTEIFYGPVRDPDPVISLTGGSGFNTGDLGMGHIVLASEDPDATIQWYKDMLGFRLTDQIIWEEMNARFLRCNSRHHSLGITNRVLGMNAGEMSHFMLEANSLDDVGRAYDAIQEGNYPLGLTLGRHSNDRTISFYMYTPSGWMIEYGYGGIVIDEQTWTPKYYEETKIWGQDFLPAPDGKQQRV